MGRRVRLWGPVIAYMALIFYESSQPGLPSVVSNISDKVLHITGYAVLGGLFLRAFSDGWRRVTLGAAVLAVLATTLYGVSDEIHQSFVPPRQMDAWDVLADAVGASIAAVLTLAWVRLARQRVR